MRSAIINHSNGKSDRQRLRRRRRCRRCFQSVYDAARYRSTGLAVSLEVHSLFQEISSILRGLTGFDRVLLSFTEFNWGLLDLTSFEPVSSGVSLVWFHFYWVFTGFDLVLPGITYVLPGFNGSYSVLPNFTLLSGCFNLSQAIF